MKIPSKICLIGSLDNSNSVFSEVKYIKAFTKLAWAKKYLNSCGYLAVYAFVEGPVCSSWTIGNEEDLENAWNNKDESNKIKKD